MVHTPSDSELLEAFKAGDRAAFQGIWDRHAEALRRFLRAHFGQDFACEDLLQEAFLSLAQNADAIREPRLLRAYLMIAVRRLGFIERRKIQRRALLEIEAAQDFEGPMVDHEKRETLARVQHLLKRFPPRRRAAFVCYCLQERTIAESSNALGISPATVVREVRAARRALQRWIGTRFAEVSDVACE